MTLAITTLCLATLRVTTLSVMSLRIAALIETKKCNAQLSIFLVNLLRFVILFVTIKPIMLSVMLSVTVLSIIMLSSECHYTVWHYVESRCAECRYAEWHYVEYRCADCRYAGCRYTDCRGAHNCLQLLLTLANCSKLIETLSLSEAGEEKKVQRLYFNFATDCKNGGSTEISVRGWFVDHQLVDR